MKKIKKRGAVYGVIALLLCAAAYLNWSYVDTPEDLLRRSRPTRRRIRRPMPRRTAPPVRAIILHPHG